VGSGRAFITLWPGVKKAPTHAPSPTLGWAGLWVELSCQLVLFVMSMRMRVFANYCVYVLESICLRVTLYV